MTSSYKDQLTTTYNAIASWFSGTRKKHWPEFDWIQWQMSSLYSDKKTLTVVEVWCGDGRLYPLLREICDQRWCTLIYTGVDISDSLLAIAQKNHPDASFVHSSMTEFLSQGETQSVDIIVGIASVQHLTQSERETFWKQSYRLLRYGWSVMLTNRSFSRRFIHKYRKLLCLSIAKHIGTLWYYDANDLMIPYRYKGKKYMRYYHIFLLDELRRWSQRWGFVIQELTYMWQRGRKTKKWQQSRNSIMHVVKSILQPKFA